MNAPIPNASDVAFTVRSYEAGIAGHVTLPSLCNYMQEAAGINAARLGWGIRALQEEGRTWMLARLRVRVRRYVPWGTTVTVRTWPSGTKGRLIAKRCFLGLDDGGAELFRASSEWLYVDLRSQKIAKLPETFGDLVPPGTPDFELPDIGGKFAHLPSTRRGASPARLPRRRNSTSCSARRRRLAKPLRRSFARREGKGSTPSAAVRTTRSSPRPRRCLLRQAGTNQLQLERNSR